MHKIVIFSVVFAAVNVLFAQEATDIDSIFQGKEFKLPKLDTTYRKNYNDAPQAKQGASKDQNESWTLQFDAVADFDAAQAKRWKLQSQTGYNIKITFDAPFYKLSGGYFKKKAEAEDKARELSLRNITAFIVKAK